MDSVNHNTNQQAISDVSNKNDEQKGSPSTDPIQSSEEAIPNDQNQPQPLDQNPRMVANDLDREYDCKYCDKRFSNKQALGGHQNAHKVERTLEKNGRNDFGSSSTPYFLSSNYRSHDLINRPNYYSWHNLSQQHELPIGCNSRPGIAMPVEPHGPPQPVQGFGHVYPGLSSPPLPRLPQFSGFSSSYNVPNHGLNFRVRNIEEGSSSGVKPVSNHQELSAFAGTFTLGPVGNHDGNNVGRVNGPGDMDVDDSGLDLTLKL